MDSASTSPINASNAPSVPTSSRAMRSRWAAIGAAVVVSLGAIGVGTVATVGAVTDSGERAVYHPIIACRLTDTRDEFQVGPRDTPLGPGETLTIAARGANGNCAADDLPDDATALQLNVTALEATLPTFLAITPDGSTDTSSLNPVPGQPPTPNGVTTPLDDDGAFKVFNLQGEVQLIIDVVGFYSDHHHDDRYYTEAEIDDRLGDVDDRLGELASTRQNVVWVATSGGDFASLSAAIAATAAPAVIRVAPGTYTEAAAVQLKTGVHVAGSGTEVTVIECACAGTDGRTSFDGNSAVLFSSGANTEVRDLSVVNTGGSDPNSIGIKIRTSSGLVLDNIAVEAFGSDTNVAIANVSASDPTVRDVRATAVGGSLAIGIHSSQVSDATFERVVADARNATTNWGFELSSISDGIIHDSRSTATGSGPGTTSAALVVSGLSDPVVTASVLTSSAPGTSFALDGNGDPFLADSTLIGGSDLGTNPTCVNVRDGAFSLLNADCL
ncbi:MAG: glycosyl hydrolase family 28-related protein [Actinomycetota bacterium]